MDQKAIDQIHLCLNEMQMVKQLIDSKAPDDLLSNQPMCYQHLDRFL